LEPDIYERFLRKKHSGAFEGIGHGFKVFPGPPDDGESLTGRRTLHNAGTFFLVLFPTDVPAGPSATLYRGGEVYLTSRDDEAGGGSGRAVEQQISARSSRKLAEPAPGVATANEAGDRPSVQTNFRQFSHSAEVRDKRLTPA
jgi:hypothetical protein